MKERLRPTHKLESSTRIMFCDEVSRQQWDMDWSKWFIRYKQKSHHPQWVRLPSLTLVKIVGRLQHGIFENWKMNRLKDVDSLLRMLEPFHDGIHQFHFDIFYRLNAFSLHRNAVDTAALFLNRGQAWAKKSAALHSLGRLRHSDCLAAWLFPVSSISSFTRWGLKRSLDDEQRWKPIMRLLKTCPCWPPFLLLPARIKVHATFSSSNKLQMTSHLGCIFSVAGLQRHADCPSYFPLSTLENQALTWLFHLFVHQCFSLPPDTAGFGEAQNRDMPLFLLVS